MKSILRVEKECYICLRPDPVQLHHIFEGSRRGISDRLGLVVWLCPKCHDDIHREPELMRRLKQVAQRTYEKEHTRTEWMREVQKNYLED